MKKVKLKKRRNKLHFRRKVVLISTLVLLLVVGIGYSLLSVDLNIFGNITVKKHYGRTLYEVFQKEAETTGLAIEYTGEHHDSFTEEPSKKIYHWYAPTGTAGDNLANQILDKNNVIFAGYCWRMIRTTDTGGVKLLYNGAVVDGTCSDTNPQSHFGYSDIFSEEMGANYYYAPNYSFDDTTNKFKLEGNLIQSTWSSSTKDQLIGMYTCKSTDPDEQCDKMSYIVGYSNETRAYLIKSVLTASSNAIGSIRYNMNSNSPAYVGYMYGYVYSPQLNDLGSSTGGIVESPSSTMRIGPSITENQDGTYIINDSFEVTQNDWSTNYNNYLYHYYCSSGEISCQVPHYIIDAGRSSLGYTSIFKMKIATSHNGYTLLDPVEIRNDELLRNYNNFTDFLYTCGNTNDVCIPNNYTVIYRITNKYYYYYRNLYFGTGVTWNGTTYELINPISGEDYFRNNKYMSYHYYCPLNGVTSCNKVEYIIYKSATKVQKLSFQNGEGTNVQLILNNMLKNNSNESLIKHIVENLRSFSRYIEDTVYCNDRNILDIAGWSNTGNPEGGLQFKNYGNLNINLDCSEITDQFSINNNHAKLKYPVGIMTINEANLFTNKTLMAMAEVWTMSACSFSGYYSNVRYVPPKNVCNNYGMNLASTNKVFPVISLKPGTEYVDGDGSMADPYVLNDEL